MQYSSLIALIKNAEIEIFNRYNGKSTEPHGSIIWLHETSLHWILNYPGHLTLAPSDADIDLNLYKSTDGFDIEFNLWFNNLKSDLTVQASIDDNCTKLTIHDIHVL